MRQHRRHFESSRAELRPHARHTCSCRKTLFCDHLRRGCAPNPLCSQRLLCELPDVHRAQIQGSVHQGRVHQGAAAGIFLPCILAYSQTLKRSTQSPNIQGSAPLRHVQTSSRAISRTQMSYNSRTLSLVCACVVLLSDFPVRMRGVDTILPWTHHHGGSRRRRLEGILCAGAWVWVRFSCAEAAGCCCCCCCCCSEELPLEQQCLLTVAEVGEARYETTAAAVVELSPVVVTGSVVATVAAAFYVAVPAAVTVIVAMTTAVATVPASGDGSRRPTWFVSDNTASSHPTCRRRAASLEDVGAAVPRALPVLVREHPVLLPRVRVRLQPEPPATRTPVSTETRNLKVILDSRADRDGNLELHFCCCCLEGCWVRNALSLDGPRRRGAQSNLHGCNKDRIPNVPCTDLRLHSTHPAATHAPMSDNRAPLRLHVFLYVPRQPLALALLAVLARGALFLLQPVLLRRGAVCNNITAAAAAPHTALNHRTPDCDARNCVEFTFGAAALCAHASVCAREQVLYACEHVRFECLCARALVGVTGKF